MLVPQQLADVIQSLGTPDFGRRLFAALNQDLRIKQCTAFGLEEGGHPVCILASGKDQDEIDVAQDLANEYISGAYNIDPVLSEIQEHKTEYHSVSSMVSSEVSDPAYRKKFYDSPRIGYEAILSARSGSRMLYFSIYRDIGAAPFKETELAYLRHVAPILVSGISRQQEIEQLITSARTTALTVSGGAFGIVEKALPSLAAHSSRNAQLLPKVSEALMNESGGLTAREAAICAHIVLGYTTLAISLNLGITINTVATHRKRAYAKLGISSQTELFGRCLKLGSLAEITRTGHVLAL